MKIRIVKADRADRALRQAVFPNAEWLSRKAWDELFASASVSRNGQVIKAGTELQVGDEILLQCRDFFPSSEAIYPFYLSACKSFAAFSKPAGMPSYPLRPWESGTFQAAVASYAQRNLSLPLEDFRALATAPLLEAGLLQRLDKNTSGVLCVAFTSSTKALFRKEFSEGGVRKKYLALVEGDAGSLPSSFSFSLASKGEARMQVVEGDSFTTTFTFLGQGIDLKKRVVSLVGVKTQDGARHIVRAALAHTGHALLGDVLYGATYEAAQYPGHLLHALSIAFPRLQKQFSLPLEIRAELEGPFLAYLKGFKIESNSYEAF